VQVDAELESGALEMANVSAITSMVDMITANRGFEIYTTRGQTKSDLMASEIGNVIRDFYKKEGLSLRFDFEDNDLDKEANFQILRQSKCPAVLLECLFFDNWEDFKRLKDPEFQKELSWHIYKGLMTYLSKYGD
jgi:N-acetylmuramoyl-L-alanine amidase